MGVKTKDGVIRLITSPGGRRHKDYTLGGSLQGKDPKSGEGGVSVSH